MTSFSRMYPNRATLDILVEDVADVLVIYLRGELDSVTVADMRETVRRELARRPAILAIDLSALDYLGVAGLDVLIRLREVAERDGTALVVTGDLSSGVARLFGLVGWTARTRPGHLVHDVALDPPIAAARDGRDPTIRRGGQPFERHRAGPVGPRATATPADRSATRPLTCCLGVGRGSAALAADPAIPETTGPV
jgi:anti-sigma B factor antagonist